MNYEDSNIKKLKAKTTKVFKEITNKEYNFPKYTTQILNLANQNSQATRPQNVGQMSELVNQIDSKTYSKWKKFYDKEKPEAIDEAVDKIDNMVKNLRKAIDKIDKSLIKDWVEELIYIKTIEGLIIQEYIFNFLEKKYKDLKYKKATTEDESKNIDGYLNEKPIQIKAETYTSKKTTIREKFGEKILLIYYRKTDKYLTIYYDEKKLLEN